jgi:cytochrome P450
MSAGLAGANFLTLWKQAGREDVVRAAAQMPPFYDRRTRAVIVAQPELCRQILSEPNVHPAPAMETYRDMPGALAPLFTSTAFVFESIPLSMKRAEHAAYRRRAAEFLARRRGALESWRATQLPGFFDRLEQPGRVELVSEVLKPMVRSLIAEVADVPLPDSIELESASLVFDKSLALSRRQALEAHLQQLIAHARAHVGPDADADELGLRVGLIVVGKDATMGSFGESLYDLISREPVMQWRDVAFPQSPHRTALPFVERIAEGPVTLAGVEYPAGTRFRVLLIAYTLEPAETHHRLFGAGAHACLGRPLSVDVWQAFAARLKALTTRVRVINYQLALDEYVFTVPRAFEVEISR